MKDSEIIDLFFERSETAVSELLTKYGIKMKSHASRYLPDGRDVEEVCNDTLVTIWNSIPPDHPKKLLTYALMVLDCKVLDRLKHMGRKKRSHSAEVLFSDFDEIGGYAGVSASAEETVINCNNGVINEFLESETPTSRKIFLKRYYYGKSISDIADELGMKENAVYVRISRTKSRLYEYLQRKGIML